MFCCLPKYSTIVKSLKTFFCCHPKYSTIIKSLKRCFVATPNCKKPKFFVFLPFLIWNHCKKPKTLSSKTQSRCKSLWELFDRCTTSTNSLSKQLSNKSARCENAKYLETLITSHGIITCLSFSETWLLKSSVSQKPKAT